VSTGQGRKSKGKRGRSRAGGALARRERLLPSELQRARDLAEEALEQQKASAEVLGAISSSISDTAPVFDKIIESCGRLFAGRIVGLNLVGEDGMLRVGAYHGAHRDEFERIFPSTFTVESGSGLSIIERRVVHFPDVEHGEGVPARTRRGCETLGIKSVIFAPVLWEGRGMGAIWVGRDHIAPFSQNEIALLRTFADQAAIAIENVRLFKETTEALKQQTATADILRVISSSPTDVQPVFEAIVRSGIRLFEGAGVTVARPDDGQVRLMAIAERDPERVRRWKERFPFPLTREYMHGVAILDCRMVDMPDVDQMDERFAAGKRNFAASGYRAMTVVPMIKDGAAIGTIAVVRDAAGPLSDKQIALLQTFADQAVIAIENVRLFNETREALEQQKASAEVLGAIGSSIADTAPVFDKIIESCERLFAGRIVGLNLVGEDGLLHLGAYHGAHREEFERTFPYPATAESGSGLSIVERRVIHFPDAQHGEGVPAMTRHGCRTLRIKSVIFAPILWEGRGMGAVFVGRDHVSSFSEKEIALLKTFANQAAIAIENVRLFNEIQEKSRQLEAASRHKSEFLANMSHELRTPLNAIIGFTRIVMRRSQERLEPVQLENLERILASSRHLLALINSILDLAKVEAGRVEVNAGEIALPPVLESCARTVEPLVRADAVTLVKDFGGALPQMVVDEEKLRQIVINLLSNAAKFTSRGSIRLQAQASNGSVAIAVSDTGIGIPPDKLEAIFEEFAQVDASSTRVYGGTGLGLTIARRLARLMGGEITAESVLGGGSKFTLTLPIRYALPGA